MAMIYIRLLAELPISYRCSNLTYVSDSNMGISTAYLSSRYPNCNDGMTFTI